MGKEKNKPHVSQIKSKARVADHGEVYTADREVNAMLDLVKQETERIDSRFLEPACGNGNFLSEILKRKLDVVSQKYKKSQHDYELNSLIALSSIYGVDILEDNVEECVIRLFNVWNDRYVRLYKGSADKACTRTAGYILRHNILCGNALTMLRSDGDPIVFAEWEFTGSTGLVIRRDYRLDELMKGHDEQMTLDMVAGKWKFDEEVNAWMPTPIKEYPPTDYLRIADNE